MERTPHTSRIVLLAASLVFVVSGCGKPWVYHMEHYDGPFDAIAQSNKTYFHSPKTGKIIPKEECRGYCEPGCYGFEPTTWTHWPTQCPGKFPVQGEVYVEPFEQEPEFDYAYPEEAMDQSVMYGDVESEEPEIEIAVPPPARQMPVDPSGGLEDPVIVPVDALPDETQPPASPSVTIPSDLESSSPSPSDAADALVPELPESPVRLAPPSTKILVDDPTAESKSNVKDPTVQLAKPIQVKARLIQANGYGPVSYAPVQTEKTKESNRRPGLAKDNKSEEEQLVAKRSITATLGADKLEATESAKNEPANSVDADDEMAVRKLVRTPNNDIVLTVATNNEAADQQQYASPIPATVDLDPANIATASSKLHQIRLARGNGGQTANAKAQSQSLSNKLKSVRQIESAQPKNPWQGPQRPQAVETYPVRPVSHSTMRDSTPEQPSQATARLQEIKQTSGEASPQSKPQVRRAHLSDDLFSTDKLERPKKLRLDPSVAPPGSLPSLRRMTPAGLPLARKVTPQKPAKASSKPTGSAVAAAPKLQAPKKVKPEVAAAPQALPMKPATKVASKTKVPSKKTNRVTSKMSKQIVVGQPLNRPQTSVPKVILKPELTAAPKGIVTANPLAARSLAVPSATRGSRLQGPIPHTKLQFDASTRGSVGNQISQPILATRSPRLAKPKALAAATKSAAKNAKPTSMLGFSSKTRVQGVPTIAPQKPSAVVSVTVSDEGSGMLQFAKDPPKRKVRISSLPDAGPSIRFR